MLQTSFLVFCVGVLGRLAATQIDLYLNDTQLPGNERINYPKSYSVGMPDRWKQLLEGQNGQQLCPQRTNRSHESDDMEARVDRESEAAS